MDELTKAVEALNAIKGSIVAAYRKRCKVSAEELATMMDAETWMGAAECLEKGFVDEINGSVMPVLNGSSLIVNSVKFDTCKFKNQDALKACINKKTEEKTMNEKLEAFLNGLGLKFDDDNQPAAPAQNVVPQPAVDQEAIAKAAVEAERQRVAELEALDSGDNTAVTAIINKAKAAGKTAADVQPYIDAVKALPPVQNAAQQVVANMIEDAKTSGAEGIGSGAVDEAALEKAADAKAMDNMVKVMNKKFGGAK